MAEYVALFEAVLGCDFSIDCGKKIVYLKSKDLESAKIEVERWIDRLHADKLFDITIIEITCSHTFDLQGYLIKLHDEQKKEIAEKEEEKNRKLWEQLRSRYGDK